MHPLEKDRIIGVDIAKIVAMLFVVGVHVNGMGLCAPLSGGGIVRTLAGSLLMTCVNIFAMVSGYTGVSSRFRLSKIANLWLQTVFTCFVVALGASLVVGVPVSGFELARWSMPVAGGVHWYITAYFMLMFAMPFLNCGLRTLPKRESGFVLAVAFVIVCGQAVIGIKGGLDTNGGYSFAWLALLYLLGGWWRLHSPCSGRCAFLWIVAAIVLLLTGTVLAKIVPARFYAYGYTSPFTLGLAFCVFNMCLSVRIANARIASFVKWLASCSLGVYLVHMAPVFGKYVFLKTIRPIVVRSAGDWLWNLLWLTIAFYAVGTLFEASRRALFSLLRIDRATSRLDLLFAA